MVLTVGCSLAAAALAAPSATASEPSDEVVGLVVTREPGTTAAQAQARVADEVGADTTRSPVAPGVTAVSVPDLSLDDARRAARELEQLDGIESVGIDTRVRPDAVVDDPRFTEQWSLTDPVSGMGAPAAWSVTQGAGAVIAVIDSGITSHEDLAGHVLDGYDMVTDPVVANDGDSRDPDPSDPGDWVESSDVNAHPDLFDATCLGDSTWHGTHVAGLAAAVTDNGKGIAGMAPQASILPVRALGKCGGRMSDIAAGITWASGGDVPGVPANPRPAHVINLSVSSTATCQPYVQAAIDGAIARGTTVVASAGNKSAPITNYSPANCYDVITVGALARNGKRAAYSNYGVAGRDLPIFAPGGLEGSSASALLSTVNAGIKAPTAALDQYAAYPGTSMAAPLVAGAAALLRTKTGMPPLAIIEHLRDTVRPFPAGGNCTGSCGAGIVDINAALSTEPGLPQPPTGLKVMAADGALSAEWTPPKDTGTAPINGYAIQYRAGSGQWLSADTAWNSTLPRKVVGGLSNGVPYEIRVATRTVFGVSEWTQSATVTPLGLPGAVKITKVKYPTKKSVRLSVRTPVDPFDAMQYRVTREGSLPAQWLERPAGPLLLSVPKGVRHTVEVRVVNGLGAGPTAAQVVATPVAPGAARSLTAKRSGSRAVLRWSPPKRTGLTLRYQVRVGQGPWRTTEATKITLRGIKTGPAVFQVRTRNEVGRGPVASLTKRK